MKYIISMCTIAGLILSGCQTPTNERTFMTLAHTELPVTKPVRYSGQYRLYSNPPRNPTTQNATPLLEARLAKGELLGFALSDSNNKVAVIRGEQKPLPNASSYTWTMQPDAQQFDPDRTIALVIVVIGVVCIVGGIVSAASVPFK